MTGVRCKVHLGGGVLGEGVKGGGVGPALVARIRARTRRRDKGQDQDYDQYQDQN